MVNHSVINGPIPRALEPLLQNVAFHIAHNIGSSSNTLFTTSLTSTGKSSSTGGLVMNNTFIGSHSSSSHITEGTVVDLTDTTDNNKKSNNDDDVDVDEITCFGCTEKYSALRPKTYYGCEGRHAYCALCFNEWKKKKNGIAICPFCRK